MKEYCIANDMISITVKSLGAELVSLKDVNTMQEYMWGGDPAFWGRTSPVLFPFVGGVRNKEYRYDGKTYPMAQHGFARDMEFELTSRSAEEIWFSLDSNEDTLQKYPFAYRLEIGYAISGRSVKVLWRVTNMDEKIMYFSIGGHPAFLCPPRQGLKQTDCAVIFDEKNEIISTIINEHGLASKKKLAYALKDGNLPVTEDLFDGDALVIENHQAQEVSLADNEGKVYLTVNFNAPLFGIWSPPHKNAPFICVEPWYGRCDAEDFNGELQDREWGNTLEPGSTFLTDYTVTVY